MACVLHPGAHQHRSVGARGIGRWRWEAVPGVWMLVIPGGWTCRQSIILMVRARTSETCERRGDGMNFKRSIGGGEGESNESKRMVAQHTGSVRCSRAQCLGI